MEVANNAKVVIFHEILDTRGGAEQVLMAILEIYPQAEVRTLWASDEWKTNIKSSLKLSFLQHFPSKLRRNIGVFLMPLAWKSLNFGLKDADLIITSSYAFAHLAVPRKFEEKTLHYIHTPGRYWWFPEIDRRINLVGSSFITYLLKSLDKFGSRNHKNVLANSKTTKQRIEKCWKMDAKILYPPVDCDFFNLSPDYQNRPNEEYILGVGRFVEYKNHKFIIDLGTQLNILVVLAGSGPLENYLREYSLRNRARVKFEILPSNIKLRELYRNAKALVFPNEEDFGIVPVEAMACGTPVLGISAGGLLETVLNGRSGILCSKLEIEEFNNALISVLEFNREVVRNNALKFAKNNFKSKFKEEINRLGVSK